MLLMLVPSDSTSAQATLAPVDATSASSSAMANCFSMSSPPSALVRRQLVDRRGQHAPQLVPDRRILGAVLPPHCLISHCSSIHPRRYASRYNETNSSSSRGDVSDELACLRPQPARRVRGRHAGRQRDKGGEAARHESARTEPC